MSTPLGGVIYAFGFAAILVAIAVWIALSREDDLILRLSSIALATVGIIGLATHAGVWVNPDIQTATGAFTALSTLIVLAEYVFNRD